MSTSQFAPGQFLSFLTFRKTTGKGAFNPAQRACLIAVYSGSPRHLSAAHDNISARMSEYKVHSDSMPSVKSLMFTTMKPQ